MLVAAFSILGAAVVLGSVLAVLHLWKEGVVVPPWPLAAFHGLLAIGGFVFLLFALRGPPRGLQTGSASFGMIAAVLVALAILAGVGIFAMHILGKRQTSTLIGVHATLAIGGFVILAAYLFNGS